MAKTARELLDLEENWDTYGASKIMPTAVRVAESLEYVPTAEGGIQIELHAGGAEVEIEISSTGAVKSVYWAACSTRDKP